MSLPDKNHINRLKMPDTDTLVILNGVYQPELSSKCDDLIFDQQTLKIPQNTEVKKPIHLLCLNSQDCDHAFNVIAEKNSRFTLVEEHNSLKNHVYTNNIKINIIAKNNSEITYYKLQNENDTAAHKAKTNITQECNSKVISGFLGKGAKVAHDMLQVTLTEENATYNAIGIISLHNAQALDYQIRIDHLVPNCTSNLLFKGVFDDEATGTFDCLVVAHPNAIKTETHVTNKNLLLAESATINTSPQLEIYADDVICTHGATVGQLDQEALFYLRSRGLAENIATKILTTVFTQEIIDQFAEFCRQKISRGIAYGH